MALKRRKIKRLGKMFDIMKEMMAGAFRPRCVRRHSCNERDAKGSAELAGDGVGQMALRILYWSVP
jgi:hypothetical protein